MAQWTAIPLAFGGSFGFFSELRCGDIDGDGEVDVLVAFVTGGKLSWFETTGPSTPSIEHVISTTVPGVRSTELHDLDSDGDLDVFAGWFDDLAWFENDGQGGFAVQHPIPQPYSTGLVSTMSAELADFDHDCDADLLLTTTNSWGGSTRNVHWYENAAGSFTLARTFYGSANLGQPTVADLDADGDVDILIPFVPSDPSPWFRNDPAPGGGVAFHVVGAIPTARWTLPTDFDGDGDLDLILVSGTHVSWSENTGTDDFGPRQVLIGRHPVGGNTFILAAELGDVDGDGDDDLFLSIRPTSTTASGTLNRVSWYENLGNQTLGARQDIVSDPSHQAFVGFAVADLDGDGDLDVAATERGPSVTGDLVKYSSERLLGLATCAGVVNSTGVATALSATGSPLVVDNEVTLLASDMPLHSYGYFLTSLVPGFVPNAGGSQGNLCLGGSIGRYSGPGQVLSSGAAGMFQYSLDLSMHPTPTGPVQVAPGETWTFQVWHRDTVGGVATSNFSQGHRIVFL